jgi:hypothetical protein
MLPFFFSNVDIVVIDLVKVIVVTVIVYSVCAQAIIGAKLSFNKPKKGSIKYSYNLNIPATKAWLF